MPTAPTTAIQWARLPGDGYTPDGDDWDEWYRKYQENIERYEMQLFDLTQMTERAKKVAKLREAEVKRQRQELIELQREVKRIHAVSLEENKKLQEEEGIIRCCDCYNTQSHKKTKWTYITGDTDTNLSLADPVWYCDECLNKEKEE